MSLGSISDLNDALLATRTATQHASNRVRPSLPTRARPASLTTSELGIAPSMDPVTDQERLQRFIDDIATDGIIGVIDAGHWLLHRTLQLHDGIRLCGRGMNRTIIEARTEDWQHDDYTLMGLGVNNHLNENGIFLSDFNLIGADKSATRNGAALQLNGINDFSLERIKVVDGSDAGIRIAGYGVGRFTNDITSNFWNSTKRGKIQGCIAVRGSLGIELEGGVEGVLVEGNHIHDSALHGIRLPSAYDCILLANHVTGARNGIWIDRHRGIHVLHNTATRVERGCVYGGFNRHRDGEISQGLWIIGNRFQASRSTITDAYHGSPDKFTHIVKIKDNILEGGNIRLLWSRRVDIQGNDGDGGNAIITSHQVSGRVGNNAMRLLNRSPLIRDLGNNFNLSDT